MILAYIFFNLRWLRLFWLLLHKSRLRRQHPKQKQSTANNQKKAVHRPPTFPLLSLAYQWLKFELKFNNPARDVFAPDRFCLVSSADRLDPRHDHRDQDQEQGYTEDIGQDAHVIGQHLHCV